MRDRSHRLAIVLAAAFAALAAEPTAAYDWLQFNGDAAHSGNNTAETILGAGNVASLALAYPQLTLRGTADGAPVFLQGVTTAAGAKDLLFVTTTSGWIQSLDAATGVEVWSKQYGTGTCTSSNGSACVSTSSPAIDPNRQFVYGYGLDGHVHKYAVGTGVETIGNGWPATATLKPSTEKNAAALAIATGRHDVSVRGQRRLPWRQWRLPGTCHRHRSRDRRTKHIQRGMQRQDGSLRPGRRQLRRQRGFDPGAECSVGTAGCDLRRGHR